MPYTTAWNDVGGFISACQHLKCRWKLSLVTSARAEHHTDLLRVDGVAYVLLWMGVETYFILIGVSADVFGVPVCTGIPSASWKLLLGISALLMHFHIS